MKYLAFCIATLTLSACNKLVLKGHPALILPASVAGQVQAVPVRSIPEGRFNVLFPSVLLGLTEEGQAELVQALTNVPLATLADQALVRSLRPLTLRLHASPSGYQARLQVSDASSLAIELAWDSISGTFKGQTQDLEVRAQCLDACDLKENAIVTLTRGAAHVTVLYQTTPIIGALKGFIVPRFRSETVGTFTVRRLLNEGLEQPQMVEAEIESHHGQLDLTAAISDSFTGTFPWSFDPSRSNDPNLKKYNLTEEGQSNTGNTLVVYVIDNNNPAVPLMTRSGSIRMNLKRSLLGLGVM